MATTTVREGVYYDPYDREILEDPYPIFRRLRESAPLYYNEPFDFYAVSRFDDVERALVDRETFSSRKGVLLEMIKADFEMPPGTLIHDEAPIHTIHRSLLSRVFKPRADPPVTSTWPDCRSVVVNPERATLSGAIDVHVPVRGSKISASGPSVPPTTRTRPSFSLVAAWPNRAFCM